MVREASYGNGEKEVTAVNERLVAEVKEKIGDINHETVFFVDVDRTLLKSDAFAIRLAFSLDKKGIITQEQRQSIISTLESDTRGQAFGVIEGIDADKLPDPQVLAVELASADDATDLIDPDTVRLFEAMQAKHAQFLLLTAGNERWYQELKARFVREVYKKLSLSYTELPFMIIGTKRHNNGSSEDILKPQVVANLMQNGAAVTPDVVLSIGVDGIEFGAGKRAVIIDDRPAHTAVDSRSHPIITGITVAAHTKIGLDTKEDTLPRLHHIVYAIS
ncbi:hypothetical protein KC945_01645 [Candidatus Saccharibacteria bacterium]|nr:hypothetical protein [Candidatus Saccharibacteria bacterium]